MNGNTGSYVRTAIQIVVGILCSFMLYFMQVAREDLKDLRHEVTVARQESTMESVSLRRELTGQIIDQRREFYERIALMERRLR